MATRLGVDIGGTFSDLVFYDDATGEIGVGKGSSTPATPEEGVLSVVSQAVPGESLSNATYFVHGATVALNALVERKGATVGLLTTAGFRDVLELGRGDRVEHINVLWKPREPLVPRNFRREVRERILHDGTIDTPLSRDDVVEASRLFSADGVTSIAIAFINSYTNPDHEIEAERVLRDAGFKGEISLSHRVSGEMREFERTSTTVIDGYIKGRVARYLAKLAGGLQQRSFGGSFLMTRSGGGAVTFDEAAERPFETIMSGPVGGAVGAGELCRALGIPMAVTADVGGTTFDTCLILDGRPELKYEGAVEDMPVQTPWVDVRSIGAGGGSLAHVDEGRLLRVGPHSAGAQPGPACYGRGGQLPTVTDAAATLGMLAFGRLAGGVTLDFDASRRALEPLAATLGLSIDETAQGIMRIAASGMANAIREITLEQGRDPREAAVIAFGGAGPLFGTLLAQELDIAKVVVPLHAGNFSAYGLLVQDIARSRSRTSVAPLTDDGLTSANATLQRLFDDLGSTADEINERQGALDLRYYGQEYTLTVPLAVADDVFAATVEDIERRFSDAYTRVYGHTLDVPVELVAVRATLRTPLPKMKATVSPAGDATREEVWIDAHSFTAGQRVRFAVLERADIAATSRVSGPAIILEPTTTTYVDIGFRVEIDEAGAMLLVKEES